MIHVTDSTCGIYNSIHYSICNSIFNFINIFKRRFFLSLGWGENSCIGELGIVQPLNIIVFELDSCLLGVKSSDFLRALNRLSIIAMWFINHTLLVWVFGQDPALRFFSAFKDTLRYFRGSRFPLFFILSTAFQCSLPS